jgi:hypothetical protein
MFTPSDFDERFLEWFGEHTSQAWANYRTTSIEEYIAAGSGGADWQQGTRWVGGLTKDQIAMIEHTWAIRFPPDYTLFLEYLHTVDRPLIGAYYVEEDTMAVRTEPAFFNWLDPEEIRHALDSLLHGLLSSVERNSIWLDSWGVKPANPDSRQQIVESLILQAPRLIPIFGHRFLLSQPDQIGNPVLSIHQADAIVFAPNLHDYFLFEFSKLLGLGPYPRRDRARMAIALEAIRTVPFWGELITGDAA